MVYKTSQALNSRFRVETNRKRLKKDKICQLGLTIFVKLSLFINTPKGNKLLLLAHLIILLNDSYHVEASKKNRSYRWHF